MKVHGTAVQSIFEYLEAVKALYSGKELLWFRGQSKDHDKLKPKLLRITGGIDLEDGLYYRFQAKAIPLIDKLPNSYFEWLFVMQHYGLPTRLLDWTTDALIALSFAVMNRDEKHKDNNAIVYCLEPYNLNKEFNLSYEKPDNFIPNIIMEEIVKIFSIGGTKHYRWPIACIGPLNNMRIIAQKGVFTLFPARSEDISLKHMPNTDDFLTAIEIDKNFIDQIQKDLSLFGINENTIYPSLENLSHEIEEEFGI